MSFATNLSTCLSNGARWLGSEGTSHILRTNRNRDVFFALCLILLTFTRFYLLRAEDINALPSGYDDYLYCELSEHTFWGRPPDDRSMIRLPAYPLWIRLCHQVGLPLYLGTTLLAISAWLFLIYALRTIRIPRTACA